jgi:dTDP-4-dehydrorhamnose reductase
MLAEATGQILAMSMPKITRWVRDRSGLYHLAAYDSASRFQWAKMILELDPNAEEQIVQEIQPAQTMDFPTPAARPLYSALSSERFLATFGFRLPTWLESLQLAMERG